MSADRNRLMSLTLTNVKKTYVAPDGSSVPVIDVPSLQIGDGEQVALIDTSGSGKTTLLHIIAGILAPDEGQISFGLGNEGTFDIAALPEAQRDVFRGRYVGYIFQT